ncbi:MAG TPA: APC family permease [Candidatus Limnocylindria bacterium]|jgi:amino acid transporter|nr:APC family permease [Candidatus Limnocylindria bacterium]
MSGEEEKSEAPSLERRVTQPGRHVGDRYVRIVRPIGSGLRGHGGRYVATEQTMEPAGRFGRAIAATLRFLIGRRLHTEAEGEERVGVATGLPILASDNISSSAYATEEAMRVLAIAGAAALTLTMPIAIAVVFVLAIVILSESRVIRAYPNGGGSYLVARENHGVIAGLVAASALLIDYVLTVAVSTAAGVAAISSFMPELHEHRVLAGVVLIALLTIGNLRGVREAGLLFAAPTYAYMLAMFGLLAVGFFRVATGDVPPPVTPPQPFPAEGTAALSLLLVLRAFASGSVALTGSEAVANGVPSFRRPETRNAVITLVLMGTIFAVVFLGITYLATTIGIRPDEIESETVNSMITRAVVGAGTPFYYVVQVTTAVILLLAANTGFTGFPRLASVLANDRFMPRHFADVGSRLAFNTGIASLAVLAGAILAAFGGSVTNLVPLYTIGVFLAFTLSQSGLVRRWRRLRNPGWRLSVLINSFGTLVTGTVLVVVAVTKFAFGAWMVLVLIPLIVALLYGIHRHYRTVQDALLIPGEQRVPVLAAPVVIVPIARLDRAALQALAFARSVSPSVKAVHVSTSRASADEFRKRWARVATDVPLDVLESPFRSLVQPLLRYIDAIDKSDDRPITVVVSEFVPRHWWEWLLHSQTAFRLKAALLFRPNTIVIDVPYHYRDTADLAGRSGESADLT